MIAELIKERYLPEFRSREEMLDLLLKKEYGYFPDIPYEISVSDPVNIEKRYCDGRVCYSSVNMTVTTEFGSHTFPIRRILHTDGSVNPFFILLAFDNNVPNRSYPTEEVADCGFDVLTINYKEVTKENRDFTDGLPSIFLPNGREKDTDCGKIMYWAWAAMRVMDYAQTLSGLDFKQAAVAGHSRLGKTALLCSMLDQRFQYAISNCSGCSGAALTRGNQGETIPDILNKFYYWFCPQYKAYADHYPEDFDQHYLLASIAPRNVYVCSASMDAWADPNSEFLGCLAASEEFERLGLPGFIHEGVFPSDDVTLHQGTIGYHRRPGMHFLSRHDWHRYMAFIRLHGQK